MGIPFRAIIWSVLLTSIVTGAAFGGGPVSVGQKAPTFSVPDANGKTFDLSSYRGKQNLILVFYRGYF
jgi:cytochrome oxidase Cu insertion factor (SCO1/SenC/PrrC family)